MRIELFKDFTFEASHFLPNVPPGHKCGRMHGHSYHVTVRVAGEVEPARGWLVDYAEIAGAFNRRVFDALDHTTLNDTLTNPTTENLAVLIWNQMVDLLPLSAIEIRETGVHGAIYRGPSV